MGDCRGRPGSASDRLVSRDEQRERALWRECLDIGGHGHLPGPGVVRGQDPEIARAGQMGPGRPPESADKLVLLRLCGFARGELGLWDVGFGFLGRAYWLIQTVFSETGLRVLVGHSTPGLGLPR